MQRGMPEHPEKQRRNKEQEQGREALKNKLKRMASLRNSNLGHVGERRMLSPTITPLSNSILYLKVQTAEKTTSHDLKGNSQVPHAHPLNDFVTSASCVLDA